MAIPVEDFRAKFRSLIPRIKAKNKEASLEAARELAQSISDKVPVRTGALRDSIRIQDNSDQVSVVTDSPYYHRVQSIHKRDYAKESLDELGYKVSEGISKATKDAVETTLN